MPASSTFRTAPATALCVMQTTVTTIVSYGFLPEEYYDYRSASDGYIHVFPGGYDYRSVEVNGTEYTAVGLVRGMERTIRNHGGVVHAF